jgi:hypothetical protein
MGLRLRLLTVRRFAVSARVGLGFCGGRMRHAWPRRAARTVCGQLRPVVVAVFSSL